MSGGGKNLDCSIQPWSKFSIVRIDLNIAQGEDKNFKSSIYANISQ